MSETKPEGLNLDDKYFQSIKASLSDYTTYGLKTKGPFTLDLEKVFVPLRLAPESVNNISSEIIKSKGKISDLSIWDFLSASPSGQPLYRTIAIIGAPGSGKTTLLEHLTLTYAKKKHLQKHPSAPKLFPILLYLKEKEVGEAIAKAEKEVEEANKTNKKPKPKPLKLADLIKEQKFIRKLNPPDKWIQNKLLNQECLVLLDGLDEIASKEARQKVSQWLEKQIEEYPNTRFIVTSRPFGYRNAEVERVKVILEVQQFNLR